MSKFFVAGGQVYNLGSSIGSTDSTILLSSFTIPVSGQQITMALMNTDIAYGTIAPKTSSSEFISFTGITANADGTSTLTGVTRGLNKTYPYTSSSTFKLPHSGQSVFILSDAPQVFDKYAALDNDQTLGGINTFTQSPLVPTGGTGTQAANATDIANAITGASGTATNLVAGTTKLSVAAVSAPNPIAAGDNDPRIPTQNENDALVGQSGTAPSSSNKFEDDADTSATSSAGKLVRANGSGKIDSGFVISTEDYQAFTASGTWTKPSGFSANSYVLVQAWGGGGGGGGGSVISSGAGAAGGGGGGAYNEAKFRLSDLGATVTVTVATAAAGGTTGGADGTNGGNTTFGTLLTAYGGAGGAGAAGGGGSVNGNGGAGGGTMSAGSSTTAGNPGPGTSGNPGTDSAFGGGGAGSGAGGRAGGKSAWGGAGAPSGNALGVAIAGNDSLYGGGSGAGGSGGSGANGGLGIIYGGNGGASSAPNSDGGAGSAPAGGGGGGSRNTAGSNLGGAGGRGEVRVWVIAGI